MSEQGSENKVESTRGSKRRKSSPIWDYFRTSMQDGKAVNLCIQCNKRYSINSGNGTLLAHVRSHGFLLDISCNQSVFSSNGLVTSASRPAPRTNFDETLTKLVTKWIVNSGSSFSTVEHPDFRNMIQHLDKEYCVPSRFTIKRNIVDQCKSARLRMISELHASSDTFSLTTDSWSSRHLSGYICVTIHFVDKKWKLRSTLIDFRRFNSPHTSDATASLLLDVLDVWKLGDNVFSITTDNASDIILGVKLLRQQLNSIHATSPNPQPYHVRCLCHIINLAVKEGLI